MSRFQLSSILLSAIAGLALAHQARSQFTPEESGDASFDLGADPATADAFGLDTDREILRMLGRSLPGQIAAFPADAQRDAAEMKGSSVAIPAPEPTGVVLIVIAILCVLAMHIRKPVDERDDRLA